jgi:hypothetical protein
MKTNEVFIQPIVNSFKNLSTEGFDTHLEKLKSKGAILERWARVLDWKKDIVQLYYFQDNPPSCRVDLQTYLVVEQREIILAAISVSDLRHKKIEYRFPALFGKSRSADIVKNIYEDVKRSMDWFTQYENKKKCLDYIVSGTSGIKPKGTLYPDIVKTLSE